MTLWASVMYAQVASRDHGLVQTAIRVIFNVFHAGTGIGEVSCLLQPCQLVVLPGAPFPIHQKADTVLKGHIVVGGILQLLPEGSGHYGQAHFMQLSHGIFCKHHLSLPP